jgi:hypothetical protein
MRPNARFPWLQTIVAPGLGLALLVLSLALPLLTPTSGWAAPSPSPQVTQIMQVCQVPSSTAALLLHRYTLLAIVTINVDEVHAIVGRAIFIGLSAAVREIRHAMDDAREADRF